MENNPNSSNSILSIVQYVLIMIKIMAITFLFTLTIATMIMTSSTLESPFIENTFLRALFIIFLITVYMLQVIYLSINFAGENRPTFMQSFQICGSVGLMMYAMTHLPFNSLIIVSSITIASVSLCAILVLIICALSDPECNFKQIVTMAKCTFFSWNIFPNNRSTYTPIN